MKAMDAVVFDMDGVIFDSEKLVVECWVEIANKYGVTVEQLKEYNDIQQITLGNKIIIPYINEAI